MDFNWDRKKKGKGEELGSFVALSRGWNRVTAFWRRKKTAATQRFNAILQAKSTNYKKSYRRSMQIRMQSQ